MNSILCVCNANRVRSVALQFILEKKLPDIHVDSAGVMAYTGDAPSRGMLVELKKRGYEGKHLSRPFEPADIAQFDLILCATKAAYTEIQKYASEDEREKVQLMSDYSESCPGDEIPGPYGYGFSKVVDILEEVAAGVISKHLV